MMLLVVFLLPLLPRLRGTLVCWQCGGQPYDQQQLPRSSGENPASYGVMISHAGCCDAEPVVCAEGLACLRASVTGHAAFTLSGCYLPEDGMIGCDSHPLPNNSSIDRCVCLDAHCQERFPAACPRVEKEQGEEVEQKRKEEERERTEKTMKALTVARIHKQKEKEGKRRTNHVSEILPRTKSAAMEAPPIGAPPSSTAARIGGLICTVLALIVFVS